MSYEPTIIIRKSDLHTHGAEIEGKYWNLDGPTAEHGKPGAAYRELYEALKTSPVIFPEIELVIIKPEFTSHNGAVRKLLGDLGIDYRIDN